MARAASTKEVFLARNAGQMGDTSEGFKQGDDSAVVGRKGPAPVRVYKPTATGYRPVVVPSSNLGWVLSQGYLPECPDCGGLCERDACPSRAPVLYRVCPVPSCRKKITDTFGSPDAVSPNTNDPNFIQDEVYLTSTPELRTKVALDAHMYAYHPAESGALAPQNPRNPIAGPSPGRMAGVA